jgi:hypothetical protein
MNDTVADAYKLDTENNRIYHFKVRLPTILLIDPKGHFTWLRVITVMALDRLAFKLHLKNSHPIANVCEFLANYPTI